MAVTQIRAGLRSLTEPSRITDKLSPAHYTAARPSPDRDFKCDSWRNASSRIVPKRVHKLNLNRRERAGIFNSYVSLLEKRSCSATVTMLGNIAAVLEIDPADLLKRVDKSG